jgi:hypothetical protein
MKTVHRATAPKLLAAAEGAVRGIEEIRTQLHAEIATNTVRETNKRKLWTGTGETKPETVTYSTKDIEKILWRLAEMQLELEWWSTPPDQRGKLSKPFSLR